MPFVARDENHRIIAIYNKSSEQAKEELPPTNSEVLNFLFNDQTMPVKPEKSNFMEEFNEMRISDLGLIRVLEDLINVLIEKEVILITDLPEPAVARLQTRKIIRTRLEMISKVLDDEKE